MKTTILMTLAICSFALSAHSFLPKNDLNIPVGYKTKAFGIEPVTEEKFNAILDQVEKIYAPVIEKLGGKLNMIRKWKDGTVNAYASRSGNTYNVAMFGGLARHKEVTPDGFALVVCHELGHHIGGAPRYSGNWASGEGQSDYWATKNCAKKIFAKHNNVKIINKRIAKKKYLSQFYPKNLTGRIMDEYVKGKCETAFNSVGIEAVTLCIRSSMGGKSLAFLLADLRKSAKPKFETPDQKVVKRTYLRHPEAQCRLDTYFQGALCNVNPDIGEDPINPDLNSCNRAASHELGLRPLCWYKPKS